MKKTAAALAAVALITSAYTVDYEPGATFYEDGSCQEADGTPGQTQPDGQCLTIADYDEMFSYENLNTVPSIINPDLSIAEEAGLDPADVTPPSQRVLGNNVSEPHRFVDYFAPAGTTVAYVNGLPIRLA